MKRLLLLLGWMVSLHVLASGNPGGTDANSTVKLVYADGKIFYHEVYVEWSTEFEKTPCEFFIEGSPDGKSWVIRGKIKSHGGADRITEYQFVDKRDDLLKFYRIRKLDARTGSEILTKFEPENYSVVVTLEKVFFENERRLVMEYSVDQDQELIVRVYNRIGEEVMTKVLPSKWAGDFIFQLDVSHLKPDNYILVVNQVLLDKTVAEKAFRID
jgi:hypothetical protein